jgi:hypothetical protein
MFSPPLLELFDFPLLGVARCQRHAFHHLVMGCHESLGRLVHLSGRYAKNRSNNNEKGCEQGMSEHWKLPLLEFQCADQCLSRSKVPLWAGARLSEQFTVGAKALKILQYNFERAAC